MAEPIEPDEPKVTCAKCGHAVPARILLRHGWQMPTTKIDTVTGATIWKALLCPDATPEQVEFYKAAKAKQQRQKDAIIEVKGFEGHGKEQLKP